MGSLWGQKGLNLYYENGNVGIGTADPKAKLSIKGDFIRRVAVATGLGPNDDTDIGQITSRILNFKKLYHETAIRILYCDNLRVNGNDAAGRWEIKIDGQFPHGGRIYQDVYLNAGYNRFPATIIGYAKRISMGEHQIQVWVDRISTHSVDNYTGWENSRWTIEAQEVWI